LTRLIITAFLAIHGGYSADRVVVDPELNRQFLAQCTELGLSEKPAVLNQRLLGARKAGHLQGIRTTRRTSFPLEDQYRHASEIAARYLEKRDNVTLDDILCDPARATQFDQIATEIMPGFKPVEYRWAALNLRKANRLKPELMSHVVRPVTVKLGPVDRLDILQVPTEQGLYLFYSGNETLYVGEASNLRRRIEKHLARSDNRALAGWFENHGIKNVTLEVQQLPKATSKKVRRALESELIVSRHSRFNILRP
jgi:predicted GIY-YIG superfamily endonuclease